MLIQVRTEGYTVPQKRAVFNSNFNKYSLERAKNIINATTHYNHCGVALTTTCVMLSGREVMVTPPLMTALLILAGPEDGLWAG